MSMKIVKNTLLQIVLFTGLSTCVLQAQQIIPNKYKNILAWQFKTDNRVNASPILKGDTIFIGSLDSTFYALDARTGSKFWEYKTQCDIRSTAVIGNDLILFESGNVLYALNLEGNLVWKKNLFADNLQNEIDPWDLFHSSPLVYKENVYIGTENGVILGYRIHDGKEVFHCQTRNKEIIRTTPAISNNSIFFGDWDGVMYAYNLENVEEIWQYDTKEDTIYGWRNSIQSAPIISNGSLYFAGRSSRLYSLNIENGTRNWCYVSPTDQWLIGGIKIKNDLIYMGSSDQRLFQAFNLKSGELEWQAKVDCRTWGSPQFNGENIYVISNSFYAFNSQTGEMKSQLEFNKYNQDIKMGKYVDKRANVHSSPILYDNKIIFGSDDGYIYAIDLSKI